MFRGLQDGSGTYPGTPAVQRSIAVGAKHKPLSEEIRVREDVVEDEEVAEEDVRREEVEIEDQTVRGRREAET